MLRQRLTDDMKASMKSGDKDRLGVIRLVISEVKKADVETKTSTELDDAGIMAVMTKMVKQRRDSVEQFTKGGRSDLADKELAEIKVIEGYLPQQMNEADSKTAIAAMIKETGAAGPKDMGKVIGALKTKFPGQMDFGKASGWVKELLK
jgi:uncharacterized protein YqeY